MVGDQLLYEILLGGVFGLGWRSVTRPVEPIREEAPQGITPCGASPWNGGPGIDSTLPPHADQIFWGPEGFIILTAESNPNAANASTTAVSTFRPVKRDCPPA